jgi:hypothetical protein
MRKKWIIIGIILFVLLGILSLNTLDIPLSYFGKKDITEVIAYIFIALVIFLVWAICKMKKGITFPIILAIFIVSLKFYQGFIVPLNKEKDAEAIWIKIRYNGNKMEPSQYIEALQNIKTNMTKYGLSYAHHRAVNSMIENPPLELPNITDEQLGHILTARTMLEEERDTGSFSDREGIGMPLKLLDIPSAAFLELPRRMIDAYYSRKGVLKGAKETAEAFIGKRHYKTPEWKRGSIDAMTLTFPLLFIIYKRLKIKAKLQKELSGEKQRKKQFRKWEKQKKSFSKLQKGDNQAKVSNMLGEPNFIENKKKDSGQVTWTYDYGSKTRRVITFHNGFLEKMEIMSLVCPKCKKLGGTGDIFCKDDGEKLVFE